MLKSGKITKHVSKGLLSTSKIHVYASPKWNATWSQRPLPACNARRICSIKTSCNSVVEDTCKLRNGKNEKKRKETERKKRKENKEKSNEKKRKKKRNAKKRKQNSEKRNETKEKEKKRKKRKETKRNEKYGSP